jgi:photosystem I subunit 12
MVPDVHLPFTMVSALSQAQVLIALVVAAHAGVLAVRLCFSLYEA